MRVGFSMFLAAGLTAGVAWADTSSETAMALQHAYAAAQADNITDVHKSLHRVVNCLVGPGNPLFDAQEINPCAKAGKGAIPDTDDLARKHSLQDAVEMAEMGIAHSDFEKAIMLATGAAGAIRTSQAGGDTGGPGHAAGSNGRK